MRYLCKCRLTKKPAFIFAQAPDYDFLFTFDEN